MRQAAIVLLLLLSTGNLFAAQTMPLEIPTDSTDVTPAAQPAAVVLDLPQEQSRLAYSIIIENRTGGIVRMVEPPAQFLLFRPGIDIGTVLQPASELDVQPFSGTTGPRQQIVETSAVSGLRFRLFADVATGQAGYVSLLPLERRFAAADGSFEVPSPTTVYLDIKAGYGVFGGAYPLIAGNPVTAYHYMEHATLDLEHTALTPDDMFIIEVRGPAEWPRGLELANQAGAKVQLEMMDGSVDCGFTTQALNGSLAQAGQAVAQSGLIASTGSALLEVSCLPAAQPSVLQLAPLGYQADEALPPEMRRALIAGVEGYSPMGQPPFFSGFLYPLSGLEIPRRLPQLSVSIRLNGSANWLPLAGVVVPEALSQIESLRFNWSEYDPQQAAAENPEPDLEEAAPLQPLEDLPSFRLGENG